MAGKLQSKIAMRRALEGRKRSATSEATRFIANAKRREMPIAPTPERMNKGGEEFVQGDAIKHFRQKTPLEIYSPNFGADEIAAGDWYIALSLSANQAYAPRVANYSGVYGGAYSPADNSMSESKADACAEYSAVRTHLGEHLSEVADKLIEQAYDLNGRYMSVADFGASKIRLIDDATRKGYGIGSLHACLAKIAEYRIVRQRSRHGMMGHNRAPWRSPSERGT